VRTPDFEASLWERLVTEIYALGGLAVRQKRWEDMRQLSTEPATSPPSSPSYKSWLRQGQVASSRSAVYPDSVLALAARRLEELDANIASADALKSVCEFDLLSSLVVSEKNPDAYFPNCAEFSESLVEPLVIEALRPPGSPLRQHVFAGNTEGLRGALRDFDAKARTQAALVRHAGGDWQWRAFADARTWVFINDGRILEDL
jgi:hypothetical protein